jgi:hypothetical protein
LSDQSGRIPAALQLEEGEDFFETRVIEYHNGGALSWA